MDKARPYIYLFALASGVHNNNLSRYATTSPTAYVNITN